MEFKLNVSIIIATSWSTMYCTPLVTYEYGIYDKQYDLHIAEFNWSERFGQTKEIFYNFWSQIAAQYPCNPRFVVIGLLIPAALFRATRGEGAPLGGAPGDSPTIFG
uniref:Uncharacterized protein n=1 Tax=Acrobeloides nanus TaxID=290746 RepID=A0A914DCT6_9BILA